MVVVAEPFLQSTGAKLEGGAVRQFNRLLCYSAIVSHSRRIRKSLLNNRSNKPKPEMSNVER